VGCLELRNHEARACRSPPSTIFHDGRRDHEWRRCYRSTIRSASQMGIDTHSTTGETPGASSLIPKPESVIHEISRHAIHIVILDLPTNRCSFTRSPEPIFRQQGLKALSGGRHCRCCKAKRLVSAGLGNGAVIFPFVVSDILISPTKPGLVLFAL
jgi:hypothetical protein